MAVAAAVDKRGLKRICMSCSTRFYDFSKRPIVCPNCSAEFTGDIKIRTRKARPAADETDEPILKGAVEDTEIEVIKDDEVETTEEAETISLEEAEEEDDGDDVPEDEVDADLDLDEEDDLDDDDDDDDEDEEDDEEDK